MQVLLHALNKISVQLQGRHITSGPSKLLLGEGPHLLADRDALVGREDVRHLARVQHVVDVFHERFHRDLRVTEEKY